MKHDENGELFGMAVGVGVLLMQACALLPGLLPCLLLLGFLALPLAIPVLVLGLAAGGLIGVRRGLWAIGRRVVRATR